MAPKREKTELERIPTRKLVSDLKKSMRERVRQMTAKPKKQKD